MAAGRDMRARLLLVLQDGISGRLTAITRQLSGLAGMARRLGAVGVALSALSFAGPVQAAAAYQDVLLQTQITAGGVGTAAMAAAQEAGRAWERLALETGTRSLDIAKAAQNLVAAGLSREEMNRFMPILARTATATGASLEDLSRTAVALRQNLNITTAEELTGALASMAQAGKAGMFELRDMAREFPQLTAAAQALGLTGRNAVDSLGAMLQVARQGAGSSSEAATNLANFLQKLNSPETVRNFREMGVNLEGVLQDAARRGINPIEAVIQKIRERTGGNMFRVGALFQDRQVLDFLRPILRGTQDYLDILQAARQANGQLINQDFATRMQGAAMGLALVQERGEQILRRLGLAAAANLGPLDRILTRIQRGMAWMDEHYPGVIDQTVAWVAGIAAVAGVFGILAPVLSGIASGLGILLSPLALLTAAFVGAGVIIWDRWEEFGPRFRRLWEGIKSIFRGAADFVGGLVNGDWLRAYSGLQQLWSGLGGAFRAIWDVVKGVFTGFVEWVDSWTGGAASAAIAGIKSAWSELTGFFEGLWAGLLGGMTPQVEEMSRLLRGLGGVLGNLIGSGWEVSPTMLFLQRLRGDLEAILPVVRAVADFIQRIIGPGAGTAPNASSNPTMNAPAQSERMGRTGARRIEGFDDDAPVTRGPRAGGGTTQLNGSLRIELAPGLVLQRAETNQPGVAVTGSQGPVLGRP